MGRTEARGIELSTAVPTIFPVPRYSSQVVGTGQVYLGTKLGFISKEPACTVLALESTPLAIFNGGYKNTQ